MRVLIEAIVVDTISSDLEPQPIEIVAREYDHLKDLFLADGWIDESYQTFEILIGVNHYWKLVIRNIIRWEDSPIALETRLGYVLSGNSKRIIQIDEAEERTSSQQTFSFRIKIEENENERIEDAINRFWNVEALGIEESKSVLEITTDKIRYNGERYEMSLSWRENHPILADNYFQSEKRLYSLLKKLKGKPEMMNLYKSVIEEQFEKGIIEKVNMNEVPEVGKYFTCHITKLLEQIKRQQNIE